MAKKIYLDAGHGGNSIGATYNGRKEQDDTLKLTLEIGSLLTAQGIEVKYSRTTSVNPDLSKRCAEANEWGADYFCSIHRNAYAPNRAKGFEGWIYSQATTGGDAWTKAKTIVDNVCNVCGFTNRGVKKGAPAYTDYAVNRLTTMTSVLLECGFIDSDVDNAMFDGRFFAMAEAIAKGLCAAVGVEYKNIETAKPAASATTTSDKIYKVQIGAFKSKANAEAYAAKAKAAGFDAVVV